MGRLSPERERFEDEKEKQTLENFKTAAGNYGVPLLQVRHGGFLHRRVHADSLRGMGGVPARGNFLLPELFRTAHGRNAKGETGNRKQDGAESKARNYEGGQGTEKKMKWLRDFLCHIATFGKHGFRMKDVMREKDTTKILCHYCGKSLAELEKEIRK